jgi:hypothetical protein
MLGSTDASQTGRARTGRGGRGGRGGDKLCAFMPYAHFPPPFEAYA